MNKKRILLFLMALSILLLPIPVGASSKVDKAVRNARKLYYGTEKKIRKKKLKVLTSDGCRDYYQGNRLLMTRVFKTTDICSPKGCKAEFYYDSKYRPIFIFAWKKVKGRTKEYRFYYGTDGKCYRYIGPDHKIHNYKKGRTRSQMSSMQAEMISKAYQNLHLLNFI